MEIQVVFVTDDRYAVNTATAITSLLLNRNEDHKYQIYVVANKMKEEKRDKILRMNQNGFQVSMIPYSFTGTEFSKATAHVSRTAILKFLLSDILEELDKVIYLDGDVIVQDDLLELYQVPLEESYAAVVRDVIAESQIPGILEKLKSSLKSYFNSGMMLLNLKKIREDRIRDKLFDYRREGINYYMDQDALNVVFNGNVKYLSCVYNYIPTIEQLSDRQLEQIYKFDFSKTEEERLMNAKIVHMAGREKPWDVRLPYLTDLFMKYYRQSPFVEDDLYHPSKVRREEPEIYLFPFELIDKGTDIVLWGAGKVGTVFYKQIRRSGYCKIRKWVDECYLSYAGHGRPISEPFMLRFMDVDYFVIAVKSEKFAMQIKQILIEMGIKEGKIIWRYPVCQTDTEYVDEIGQGELDMNRKIKKFHRGGGNKTI